MSENPSKIHSNKLHFKRFLLNTLKTLYFFLAFIASRKNSPADGDSVLPIFVISLNFICPNSFSHASSLSRPVEWGLDAVASIVLNSNVIVVKAIVTYFC